MKTDYHWAESDRENERMILEAVSDSLRKKVIRVTDENTLLEKNLIKVNLDRTRLRREVRKLADTVHLLSPKTEQEPNQNQEEDNHSNKKLLPYN